MSIIYGQWEPYGNEESLGNSETYMVEAGGSYWISSEGNLNHTGATQKPVAKLKRGEYYFDYMSSSNVYPITDRYFERTVVTEANKSLYNEQYNQYHYYGGKCQKYRAYVVEKKDVSRGASKGTVASNKRDAFPDDDSVDDVWYVWKGIE